MNQVAKSGQQTVLSTEVQEAMMVDTEQKIAANIEQIRRNPQISYWEKRKLVHTELQSLRQFYIRQATTTRKIDESMQATKEKVTVLWIGQQHVHMVETLNNRFAKMMHSLGQDTVTAKLEGNLTLAKTLTAFREKVQAAKIDKMFLNCLLEQIDSEWNAYMTKTSEAMMEKIIGSEKQSLMS